jgi:hypothetical protein
MVYHGRVKDGTIILDPGIALPNGAAVRVELEPRGDTQLPRGASIGDLLRVAGVLDDQSAREMMQAIEEGCERVDLDEW